MRKVHTSFRLDNELLEQINEQAVNGLSRSNVIENILLKHFSDAEQAKSAPHVDDEKPESHTDAYAHTSEPIVTPDSAQPLHKDDLRVRTLLRVVKTLEKELIERNTHITAMNAHIATLSGIICRSLGIGVPLPGIAFEDARYAPEAPDRNPAQTPASPVNVSPESPSENRAKVAPALCLDAEKRTVSVRMRYVQKNGATVCERD